MKNFIDIKELSKSELTSLLDNALQNKKAKTTSQNHLNGKNLVYNIGNNKPELNMNKLHKIMETSLKRKIKAVNISYPKNYPQVEPQRLSLIHI